MFSLSIMLRDARYGARRLEASPLATAIAVGTLGLGLGVCTAVFGSLASVWSPSQPIGDAERLVAIRWQPPLRPEARVPLAWFGDGDPLGQRFRRGLEDDEPITVVGVSADMAGSGADRASVAYVPIEQHRPREVLLVTSSATPAQDAAALRVIREFEPDVLVLGSTTIRGYLLQQMYAYLVVSAVTGTLAGIVLLLACAGLFALMSDVAASRTRELGVRLALGATRAGIARLVVWSGVRLVIAGTAVGLVCATLTASLLSRFGVAVSIDPVVFLLVALLLGTVALLAAYVPARRAGAVDPMTALRAVD